MQSMAVMGTARFPAGSINDNFLFYENNDQEQA
jgi:hypothetical protein